MQTEQQRFGELLLRLIDAFLNSLFDLRPQVATIRRFFLIFLFLLSGFLITLMYYPLNVWIDHIQDIFGYLLVPGYITIYPGNPIDNFIAYSWQAFSDPRVLQYLPIFLAPFFIALQTAANYLADVFELEDPSVARHFVWAVALTSSNETIRIIRGDVYEGNKNSPTLLIGGPGRVLVDLDSAALFEKPDGTPRVIGPTGKLPGGKARLDGFERFRQAIDLRNHVIELRDRDGKSSEILGRSLDGIPVSATDVSFLFTVYRGDQNSTAQNPFPFNPEAIERLIYKASSKVTPNQDYPSSYDFNWINGMVSLIRGRLGSFISDHRLTEYLSSIGQLEANQFNKSDDKMTEAVKALTQSNDPDLPRESRIDQVPLFTPRDRLKQELFNLYAEDFSKTQRERGVQLYWVGLGTWRVPVEIFPETKIVSEQHLEAWKISHENIVKESNISNRIYKTDAAIQKFVNLIQEIPVARSLMATDDDERMDAMKALLNVYRLQLIEAAEFQRAKGVSPPKVITDAINCLDKALGKPRKPMEPTSFVSQGPMPGGSGSVNYESTSSGESKPSSYGSPSSSGPSSPSQDYDTLQPLNYWHLVSLLGGDKSTSENLIDFERKNFPNESREELIERAIERLLHDRK